MDLFDGLFVSRIKEREEKIYEKSKLCQLKQTAGSYQFLENIKINKYIS